MTERPDVIVVGAGVAGLSAALSAHDAGASVEVIECAPMEHRGGNTAFAAGSVRFAYNDVEDLLKVIPDLTASEIETTDFGSYTDGYAHDMDRVTEGRADPELVAALVDQSLDAFVWMRGKGVRFLPNYGRQSFREGTKRKFLGGCPVEVSGGGLGLLEALYGALGRAGIPITYETRATSLILGETGVEGVRVKRETRLEDRPAGAVVLASGGFESNTEWRARYLGPGWDLAKVRGTPFNTGDGLRMALDAGAAAEGNWSGCHSVAWDLSAPKFGDIAVGNDFKKDSFQYAIVVNAKGERFLDEGADFRNFTYAKYGAVILQQPGQFAWQVFDAKVLNLLRDEYRIRQVTKVRADTIEELAENLYGVDPEGFLRTVREFNAAVMQDRAFNPNVKDGRATRGLSVPKSNWANTIDEGPFEAYGVTCGITFTFGGVKISPSCHVIDVDGNPVPGLFACGTIAGGLFYFNYPGGAGLAAGAVFGRAAGHSAAAASKKCS